jgi:hypothetical protein
MRNRKVIDMPVAHTGENPEGIIKTVDFKHGEGLGIVLSVDFNSEVVTSAGNVKIKTDRNPCNPF